MKAIGIVISVVITLSSCAHTPHKDEVAVTTQADDDIIMDAFVGLPMPTSPHMQAATLAIKQLKENDSELSNHVHLHALYIHALKVSGDTQLALNYTRQVKHVKGSEWSARLQKELEKPYFATWESTGELDEKRVALRPLFDPVLSADPVLRGLIYPPGASSLVKDDLVYLLDVAEDSVRYGRFGEAVQVLETYDSLSYEESFHVLHPTHRKRWSSLMARAGEPEKIRESIRKDFPLLLDAQRDAGLRFKGLLQGCETLSTYAFYEDARRFCDRALLVNKKHNLGEIGQDRIVALSFQVLVSLEQWDDAQSLLATHSSSVWKQQHGFELFKTRLMHSTSLQEFDELAAFAREELSWFEETMALLAKRAHLVASSDKKDRTAMREVDSALQALIEKTSDSCCGLMQQDVKESSEDLITMQVELLYWAQKAQIKDDTRLGKASLQNMWIEQGTDWELAMLRFYQYIRFADAEQSTHQVPDELVSELLGLAKHWRYCPAAMKEVFHRYFVKSPEVLLALTTRMKSRQDVLAFLTSFEQSSLLSGLSFEQSERFLNALNVLESSNDMAREVMLLRALLSDLPNYEYADKYLDSQVLSLSASVPIQKLKTSEFTAMWSAWGHRKIMQGFEFSTISTDLEAALGPEHLKVIARQILQILSEEEVLPSGFTPSDLQTLESWLGLERGGQRDALLHARVEVLRARTGNCRKAGSLSVTLFEAFPPALAPILQECAAAMPSKQVYTLLTVDHEPHKRALREIFYLLVYE